MAETGKMKVKPGRSVVNNKEEDGFSIASVLFIAGGVILVCSLLFAVYTVFTYFMAYEKLTSFGLLMASVTVVAGVYLSFTAFGISKIIEQNKEIISRLKNPNPSFEEKEF